MRKGAIGFGVWNADAIADALLRALEEEERRLGEEQAVYGLDALDEVRIHGVLAAGLAAAGWGVLREQAYPTQWKRKRTEGGGLPLPRERERCDIVLTPTPGAALGDALTEERARLREIQEAAGTLFAGVAGGSRGGACARATDPGEAYWLEVKVVGQHQLVDGVLVANPAYASQLLRGPYADLAKLEGDRGIVHAGAAVVLFAVDARTAAHDLGVLFHRCVDRALRISPPVVRQAQIADRIGNARCAVGLIPLRPG